jgi:hypothetical protein
MVANIREDRELDFAAEKKIQLRLIAQMDCQTRKLIHPATDQYRQWRLPAPGISGLYT